MLCVTSCAMVPTDIRRCSNPVTPPRLLWGLTLRPLPLLLSSSGAVDKDERVAQLDGFRKIEGEAYFIIQIKAGGQGLNLQEATRVYIMAPSWNPATELQAIARSHRTGQTQRVFVKKLVCTGDEKFPSVEESIMNLQGHKSIICAEVLNDPRVAQQIPTKTRSSMTLADILNIFRV